MPTRQAKCQNKNIEQGLCESCGQPREPDEKRVCKACKQRKRELRRGTDWHPGQRGRPPVEKQKELLVSKIESLLTKLEQVEKKGKL